ncbi:DNA polymerase III subunit gamma/tau [Bacteroides caecigallinarum]|uniref:DNA polymerase III subunit gamma/tau n=1 Tax=Bacteroides caecigallinarum TaxID=1411144 RepID=UPI00195EE2FD|nr:DNA polymerase III subunit gamma/tau [Bacteroides caecigallinarum]MBM6889576.1 DNA polymerase III subunit gamma/tau [Bacteroides caecigallinarum]
MDNYIVSARKYRPATFDTVVGQRALTTTLKNAIANNKLAHAYLFCGPRGVGKTTCARIFAKTINCLSPKPDGEACNECESCKAFNEQRSYNIHELDAASNNSVEDIRSLIEQVRIPPQIGKYKVYIIDEVHMLSTAAFNAFLKTLEEPPHHAIFILATTEKHKILPTILSRCQIYDFSRISVTDTVEHLQGVAQKEGIDVEPEALTVIAQKADGGMRDALSIFDQVTSFSNGHITYKSVIENLNVLDYEYYFKLTDYILENKVSECMLLFNEVLKKGFDGNHFITGLSSHFRDLLVSRDEQTLQLLEVGASIRERYKAQAQKCEQKFLYKAMKLCNDCDLNYRQSKNKRLLVELTLIQLAQITSEEDDAGNGRSPKVIKPIFNQQTAPAATQQQPVAQQQPITQQPANVQNVQQPVQQNTSEPQPQYGNNPAQQQMHKLPDGLKVTQEKKIPVVKAGILGPSIKKRPQHLEEAVAQKPAAQVQQAEKEWEDYDVYEKDLNYYWREFATRLPKEEKANAGRMMNMSPKLLDDQTTFEVAVDNEMVQKYMQQLAPQIENHLIEQLHNRKIRMTVRVSAADENIRAYSHVERFQMMSKKNPNLLKLKEEFGLELS